MQCVLNISTRHRRTGVVLAIRVARARLSNIGTGKEYSAEQIKNQPDLPSLSPKLEILYSPSPHVPENLTTNLLPDNFSFVFSSLPLRKLSLYQPIPPIDTDLTINDYTPPDPVPFLFHNIDELIFDGLFTPISDANRVVVRIEGADYSFSAPVFFLVSLSPITFLSYIIISNTSHFIPINI